MQRLLPQGLAPRLAIAVSGGADSTALAMLARAYCEPRGGVVLALIVDHGLRVESGDEARLHLYLFASEGLDWSFNALQSSVPCRYAARTA